MTKAERKTNGREAYNALMKFYPFTLENLDGEEWADITGYEGRYQVSTFGRVKSFTRGVRILKPQINRGGYLYVDLCNMGKVKHAQNHRLVARCFIPNTGEKPEINHRDGCKFNCHVVNLEWVTPAENSRHAHVMGLRPQGEECYQAKFTAEQVAYLRENPEHLTLEQLSKEFNASLTTISRIQRGLNYKESSGQSRDKIRWHKLNAEKRNSIRNEYKKQARGFGQRILAKKFGVSQSTIWRIIHEKI